MLSSYGFIIFSSFGTFFLNKVIWLLYKAIRGTSSYKRVHANKQVHAHRLGTPANKFILWYLTLLILHVSIIVTGSMTLAYAQNIHTNKVRKIKRNITYFKANKL